MDGEIVWGDLVWKVNLMEVRKDSFTGLMEVRTDSFHGFNVCVCSGMCFCACEHVCACARVRAHTQKAKLTKTKIDVIYS